MYATTRWRVSSKILKRYLEDDNGEGERVTFRSKRAEAVMRASKEVMQIMEDRDRHHEIMEYLLNTDPQVVIKSIQEGKVPSYTLDLVTVLTKLYDAGYANASEELEKLR